MIRLACLALSVSVTLLIFVVPIARRGRGRHLSRPVGRIARCNWFGVMELQTGLLFIAVGCSILMGYGFVVLVMEALLVVWLLDDGITGADDDDRRRKHEVRIRMPKPVKLRAAERYPAPVPA